MSGEGWGESLRLFTGCLFGSSTHDARTLQKRSSGVSAAAARAGLMRPCRGLPRLRGRSQKLFLICRLPQRTSRCYINVRLQEAVGQLKAVLSFQTLRSFFFFFFGDFLNNSSQRRLFFAEAGSFLFINQGNTIHASLRPPEGAVVINITCTRDSNQAQNMDFSRFQKVRAPRASSVFFTQRLRQVCE